MLRKLTITTAIIAICISLYLAGMHKGYVLGMNDYSSFTVSHNVYDSLNMDYHRISNCLILFGIIKILNIKDYLIFNIICSALLLLSLLPYKSIYIEKSFRFSNPELINEVLQQSYVFDGVGFSLIVLLVILQIVGIYQYILKKIKLNDESDRI